ncbi:hypothetical protein D9M69_630950 [compost metagenome]
MEHQPIPGDFEGVVILTGQLVEEGQVGLLLRLAVELDRGDLADQHQPQAAGHLAGNLVQGGGLVCAVLGRAERQVNTGPQGADAHCRGR